MKLCICDIDGVVCDSSERFKRAEHARNEKQAELDKEPYLSGDREEAKRKIPTDLYWSIALSPDLLQLDKLIDDAKDALERLRYNHYDNLLFLTSRPETLRPATLQWLVQHDILFYTFIHGESKPALVMKELAFVDGRVRTVTWKAGMIQTLAHLYSASEVLVIEDEAENAKAILNAWTDESVPLRLCNNLDAWKG